MQLKKEYMNEPILEVRENEIADGRIKTWSGMMLDPTDPDPSQIRIDDIAHALSNICRYGGHIPEFYSVAEHSIYVMLRVWSMGITDHRVLLMALLHDAEEAYLGDMPSPIKHRFLDYAKAGEHLRELIYSMYIPDWANVTRVYKDIVNQADADVYLMERLSFFPSYEESVKAMQAKFSQPPLSQSTNHFEVEDRFMYNFDRLSRGLPI